MPTRNPAPLPEPLRYLQPFANALAKLPPEEINEDVDASRLDAALRKRIHGMDEGAADAQLSEDRDLLERWLQDKPSHPAHWIRGFLLSADLAAHLTQPPEPPLRGPEMVFEAPEGWKMKRVPFRLDLKAGKVIGSIMSIDEFSFEHIQHEREQTLKLNHPDQRPLTWTIRDIVAGDCQGRKFVCIMAGSIPWKQVDYVLRVPGGFVSIRLGTMTGADFDESPFEAQLYTLRLSASA
jgi:hypothetical protein